MSFVQGEFHFSLLSAGCPISWTTHVTLRILRYKDDMDLIMEKWELESFQSDNEDVTLFKPFKTRTELLMLWTWWATSLIWACIYPGHKSANAHSMVQSEASFFILVNLLLLLPLHLQVRSDHFISSFFRLSPWCSVSFHSCIFSWS